MLLKWFSSSLECVFGELWSGLRSSIQKSILKFGFAVRIFDLYDFVTDSRNKFSVIPGTFSKKYGTNSRIGCIGSVEKIESYKEMFSVLWNSKNPILQNLPREHTKIFCENP